MVKAIRVHAPGGAEVLKVETIEVGAPGPGEVRIAHTAIGVNFIDIYHRSGIYPLPLPFIPGMEGVGVIEALGPDVVGLKVGDRVGYAGLIGSYSEKRLARADRLVRIPETITDEQAAVLMLKGITAQVMLRQTYKVMPGDTILIHAAAGGLGSIMCQWASAIGATVIGTVSSDEKAEVARANSCHHPIVYTRENFVERVAQITEGRKVAVVYDSVGKDTFMGSLDCLRPRGLMVVNGASSGAPPAIDAAVLAQKGSLYLTRSVVFVYTAARAELDAAAADLFAAVAAGHVRISVNQRYALSDAATAHRDLEGRKTTGSTILTV